MISGNARQSLNYSLFIFHSSLFIIHCSSFFILHSSLFIVRYSLLIIHYSLLHRQSYTPRSRQCRHLRTYEDLRRHLKTFEDILSKKCRRSRLSQEPHDKFHFRFQEKLAVFLVARPLERPLQFRTLLDPSPQPLQGTLLARLRKIQARQFTLPVGLQAEALPFLSGSSVRPRFHLHVVHCSVLF